MQQGRLTPDEMARERMNQSGITGRAKSKENVIGKTKTRPPAGRAPTRRRNANGE